ncbi:MAG TPA: LPXTG cell wall anchor domain-containing protein [Gammaproteobacteria bacterium]|nr:LPXTG cell wall anchor domain-containing protein [Gammaproteobacteria bacterium]
MWLPRPVYESLPFALIILGVLLALGGYLISAEWLQSVLLIGGSLMAVAGLVLLLKRRDYRLSRSRVKYDNLD